MPIPNNLRPLHKKKRASEAHRKKMDRKKADRAKRVSGENNTRLGRYRG